MPQVFLSYNREDQAKARLFADAFAREGLEVWWDATLRSGEAYDEVTENALRTAKAVVVLWSRKSVGSRWVRAEATLAERNKTFLPVMIEHCERPIMFELTQTSDLSGWNGDSGDPAWRAFVSDVQRYVGRVAGGPVTPGSASHIAPVTQPSGKPRAKLALLAVLPALIALGVGAWLLARNRTPPATANVTSAATKAAPGARSAASVAVVPFANLTGTADKEYFSDGMAEELINALAKVPGLNVASRTSSFAYKGKTSDIRQIARDLGVSTIIEGSVRSAGDRVRVTAQLTSADSGYQLWSESYDRRFDDLFKLQDDLAREIVTAFRRTVGTQVAEFESKGPPTRDLQAYDLYLKGVAAAQRNSDLSLREGIGLFEQAVARDPQFARAWAALATARGFANGSTIAQAEREGQRAFELDPGGPGALVLANVNARRGKYVEAEAAFASFTARNDPAAHSGRALATLWPTGRLREALREMDEARRLTPANAAITNTQAQLAIGMGDVALGERHLQEAIVLGVDPAARRVLQAQAEIALRTGRHDEAATLMARLVPDRLRPLGGEEAVKLVYAGLQDQAKRNDAIGALQRLVIRTNADEWVAKVYAMQWFSALGAVDQAYDVGRRLQEQFAAERNTNAWSWLWSRDMQAFRQDARFRPFVTRLNMMPYWEKYGPPDDCTLKSGMLSCN